MSYKALYDILCPVKRHMISRVNFRWVGNHKRRTLNTRLSSGTSEHTSSSSRNVPGRIIRSDLFWYWNKIKMKLTYRRKNLPD